MNKDKKYCFFWKNGNKSILSGNTPAMALLCGAYSYRNIDELAFYTEYHENSNQYVWDDVREKWDILLSLEDAAKFLKIDSGNILKLINIGHLKIANTNNHIFKSDLEQLRIKVADFDKMISQTIPRQH